MEVGGLTETVEVTGASPIDRHRRRHVGARHQRRPAAARAGRPPLQRRAVHRAGRERQRWPGRANPSIAGGSGLENQYVVDGVNITNTGYGALGSYSIYLGSLGNGVTYDFVNEIQVKTAGYEAEYGQSTGGVVNVLTKSGTNNLRGSVFGYARPAGSKASGSRSRRRTARSTRPARRRATPASTVGGPVLRDRIFFFGAVQPIVGDAHDHRAGGLPAREPWRGRSQAAHQLVLREGERAARQRSPRRCVVLRRPGEGRHGPQRLSSLVRTDTSAFSSLEYGGHNQTVKYDGVLRPSWLVEATVSRAQEQPGGVAVGQRVPDSATPRVVPNIVSGGIGFYEAGNEGINLQYQAKSTHIFGGHQIRYGVLYEDIEYNNINQYTGPTFTLSDGQHDGDRRERPTSCADPNVGQIYRATRANLNTGPRRRRSSTPASSRRTRGGSATASRSARASATSSRSWSAR